jgi:general stress protein 26
MSAISLAHSPTPADPAAVPARNEEMTVPFRAHFKEVETAICELLAEAERGVLATLRGDGSPSASFMSFAADGLTVYCPTPGHARKRQDLQRDPRVAYTLARLPGQGAASRLELRMVQMSGRAVFVDDPDEIDHALAVCARQFRWLASGSKRAGFERDAREGRVVFFKIHPVQALWNDNRDSAAWRVLVNFSPDGHVTGLMPYGPQVA